MPSENTGSIQENRFTLTDHQTGKSINLNGLSVTEGMPGVDITGLRAKFGVEAFDPGFKNTDACESDVTFINGEKGILMHRGIRIEALAEQSSFMETTFLLREGDLPTTAELDDFEADILQNSDLPIVVKRRIQDSDRQAQPMAVLSSAVSTLAANTEDSDAHHTIGRMATIVANIIRHQQGKLNFIDPALDLPFSENFLQMAFADDHGNYEPNPVMVEAMDKLLILHADHEQNASTTVVRSVRSAGSKISEALAAGVGTLSGPLHGGANQAVLLQLEQLASVDTHLPLEDRIASFIARAKDKDDDFRLMGFGHRVYKNRDPRAMVLKGSVDALLEDLNVDDDPRLEIARRLEEAAANDDYFRERGLYPNVDFYSGIAMSAMDLKPELFTLIFATGRVSGWVAQAEEFDRHKIAIARPRQLYVGEKERPYVPMEQRGGHNNGPNIDGGPGGS